MPSPEQLGVARPRPAAGIDWNGAYQELDRLGALGIQREHLAAGYRIGCLMPTGHADRQHRIDVEAPTEEEALRLLLGKAAEWAAQSRRP